MNKNKIVSLVSLIATILLAVGLLAFLGVQPAVAGVSAQESGNLSTPELIRQAVEARQIDTDRANLYLAYALAAYEKLPAEYRSAVPWEGTLPLLDLSDALNAQSAGRFQKEIADIIAARGSCHTSTASLPNVSDSAHFHIEYGTIGGGLNIAGYTTSLETVWSKEITEFGWAAPPIWTGNPPPGNRYHVRIDTLGGGLYGYVANSGVHAGLVGDNPNTAWNDVDAYASCMVLNNDFSPFPGTSQQALDATVAHEFNHSIQFGYGVLAGSNRPAPIFVEGGATWMEEEVFDGANDNYNYLWPDFGMAMGNYTKSPYPYWITFRGLTERYGTGTAGLGEQVMEDFWETLSQGTSGDGVAALNTTLTYRSTNLSDAFHAYAIAVKFNKTCGGGFVYPYCFEEAAGYVAAKGATAVHTTISSVGGSYSGSLADSFAINWIRLPGGSNSYRVTLQNTSAGGALRGSIVCETGSALNINPLPAVAGAGGSAALNINPAGCNSVIAVLTNQSTATVSTARSYQLATAAVVNPPGAATLISPSGTITDTTPTYTWNKVNSSTWYYLWVNNAAGAPVVQQWFEGTAVCGASTCSVTPSVTLPAGNYTWWVQTWNEGGYGPWSNAMTFSVSPAGLPGAATLVSPSGSITDTTPTYTWNRVNSSTWYYLWVNNAAGTPIIQQWYSTAQACGSGSTCSITPSVTLSSGNYTWWIQTWNEAGYGPWSNGMNFNVGTTGLPGAATLISPSGNITDTTPAYKWNKVSSSTWYYLWVNNAAGTPVIQQWYASAQVCGSTTCSVTPNVPLSGGNYTWWIQTWNEGGYGPWSNPLSFSLPGSGSGFNSQFNGTSTGWESHSGSWSIANSKWYTSPGLANLWASTSYNGTFSNFDYQVRLRRTGNSSYANCVMIRGAPTPSAADNDWNSGYSFCYVTGGAYSVWLSTGGAAWTPMQNWASTSSLNTGTAWNVVRIVANGSSLYLYINGALVWSSADPFLSSGRVGIEFSSPSPSTGNQLWVDWATLTTVVPREITDTISPEQQALNQTALESTNTFNRHYLPAGK